MTLMSVRDFPWRDWDMFAMEISASMIDYTIDEETWKFIRSTLTRYKNESDKDYEQRARTEAELFKEYYIFVRYDWKWLLKG
jgi:replicative superfamily II helicase